MKALGVVLVSLPVVLFILVGFIFDTADFLAGMGILALIVGPMMLGSYLIERSKR